MPWRLSLYLDQILGARPLSLRLGLSLQGAFRRELDIPPNVILFGVTMSVAVAIVILQFLGVRAAYAYRRSGTVTGDIDS
jgi:hypothetical protein